MIYLSDFEINNKIMENATILRIYVLLKNLQSQGINQFSARNFYNYPRQVMREAIKKLTEQDFITIEVKAQKTYFFINNPHCNPINNPLINAASGGKTKSCEINEGINNPPSNPPCNPIIEIKNPSNPPCNPLINAASGGKTKSCEGQEGLNNPPSNPPQAANTNINNKTIKNSIESSASATAEEEKFLKFCERYNTEILVNLKNKCNKLNERISQKQREIIDTMLAKYSEQKIDDFFKNLKSSNWLMGKSKLPDGRSFELQWWWLFKYNANMRCYNYERVMEGQLSDFEKPKTEQQQPKKKQTPEELAAIHVAKNKKSLERKKSGGNNAAYWIAQNQKNYEEAINHKKLMQKLYGGTNDDKG